jgi:hypothetical protein
MNTLEHVRTKPCRRLTRARRKIESLLASYGCSLLGISNTAGTDLLCPSTVPRIMSAIFKKREHDGTSRVFSLDSSRSYVLTDQDNSDVIASKKAFECLVYVDYCRIYSTNNEAFSLFAHVCTRLTFVHDEKIRFARFSIEFADAAEQKASDSILKVTHRPVSV